MATPAGALVTAVDAVIGCDLTGLSVPQLQQAVTVAGVQAQRLAAFSALAASTLNARVGGRLPTDDGGARSVAGWVGESTAQSASAAGRMIRVAGLLQTSLPGVAQGVLDGQVGFAQAEVLTRLVGPIDDAALAEAEPGLITAARAMDPVQLSAYIRHLLATWVEPVLDSDERTATDRRYLKTRTETDGSVWGSFRLAAGDAESLKTALEPLARPADKTDARSAGQRRADALVQVCEQVLRHGTLPDAGGLRPQLTYVLPADWAARQAEQHSCPDCTRCPDHAPPTFADLVAAGIPAPRPDGSALTPEPGVPSPRDGEPGVPAEQSCAVAAWTGPQTRARIETVLCDARISRLLLDSLGQVSGLESLTDSVTPRQRRALAARDLGCAARGCRVPPAMCDAHHVRARKNGGSTDLGNLVLLCRRHHVLWHLGKLRLHDLHAPWLQQPDTPPPARAPAALATFDSRHPF